MGNQVLAVTRELNFSITWLTTQIYVSATLFFLSHWLGPPALRLLFVISGRSAVIFSMQICLSPIRYQNASLFTKYSSHRIHKDRNYFHRSYFVSFNRRFIWLCRHMIPGDDVPWTRSYRTDNSWTLAWSWKATYL